MIPKHLKDIYERYIKSPEWKVLRDKIINSAKFKGEYHCQACGHPTPKNKLEVHHRHYKTLMREKSIDLMALCPSCHEKEDKRRAKQSEENRYKALNDARLDGWASAVYGEDWAGSQDEDYVAAKYEDWLAKKGEY